MAPLRFASVALVLLVLSGCLIGPMPAEPAGQDAGTLTEPAAPRSRTATETRKVSSCTRVWSEVLADSTWYCPDPKPPAPDFGGSD